MIVQIDETKIGAKRKYNRGRLNPGIDKWIFGGICTTTKGAFLRLVDNRTRETLLPIIHDRIVRGSTIWSDTWAPYFTLNNEGYTHLMVNHSENYVDPVTRMHTQEIESFWNKLKAEIKIRRGYNEHQLAGFLDEFVYRQFHMGRDIFETFMGHIAERYPVNDY